MALQTSHGRGCARQISSACTNCAWIAGVMIACGEAGPSNMLPGQSSGTGQAEMSSSETALTNDPQGESESHVGTMTGSSGGSESSESTGTHPTTDSTTSSGASSADDSTEATGSTGSTGDGDAESTVGDDESSTASDDEGDTGSQAGPVVCTTMVVDGARLNFYEIDMDEQKIVHRHESHDLSDYPVLGGPFIEFHGEYVFYFAFDSRQPRWGRYDVNTGEFEYGGATVPSGAPLANDKGQLALTGISDARRLCYFNDFADLSTGTAASCETRGYGEWNLTVVVDDEVYGIRYPRVGDLGRGIVEVYDYVSRQLRREIELEGWERPTVGISVINDEIFVNDGATGPDVPEDQPATIAGFSRADGSLVRKFEFGRDRGRPTGLHCVVRPAAWGHR